jgi:tripartite ATP-independent transporter DctM subunit
MTPVIVGFALVLGLALYGVPIAFAMISVGFLGFAYLLGWVPALALVGQTVGEGVLQDSLSVLPLFVLMGNLCTASGLSSDLYRFGYALLGRFRGGLAMATVFACGGFAAICGSSLATAATMTKVAIPPMRRFGYADSLAAASIAAGGTLGIMIPPSVIMVIYGLITETNIAKLFVAGIIPGLIGVLLYMLAVQYTVWRDPGAGPRGEVPPRGELLAALRRVWGLLALFGLVMGGLYGGVFTSTEGAAIGAAGAFILALARRALSWSILSNTLVDTAKTTAVLFTLLIGALVFANFVNAARFPQMMQEAIVGLQVPPLIVILVIVAIYLVLGCVLESISMVLLTVPVFFPVVTALGFDPIWFGVLLVMVVEIGMITPPVGMNIFVLTGVQRDISNQTVIKGLLPFIGMDMVRLALVIAVPTLSLFLPRLMGAS